MAREMYLVGVEEDELKPPPKPEPPKTPKGKWDNYWYHYKWQNIGVLAAVVILTVLIVQMVTKDSPDYRLILVTGQGIPTEATDLLAADLEKYGRDVNGDGEVKVSIENLYLGTGDRPDQMAMVNNQKLTTYIGAGEGMFFAFGKDQYEDRVVQYIEADSDGAHLFDTLAVSAAGVGEESLYWNWKDDPIRKNEIIEKTMPEEMYFGIRQATGSASSKKAAKEHDVCMELLRAYILKQPLTPAADGSSQ